MRRDMVIFLLALLIGLSVVICIEDGTSVPQASEVAWWTLFYEQPNPERLPVKVRFSFRNGG